MAQTPGPTGTTPATRPACLVPYGAFAPSPEGCGQRRAGRLGFLDAFLAASRSGDFDALLELLDPDVVLRADAAAVAMGTTDLVSGARAVAETFAGRARAARPALVEGTPGAAWATGGQPRIAFLFSLAAGRIVAIEILGDPARLASVELSDGEG